MPFIIGFIFLRLSIKNWKRHCPLKRLFCSTLATKRHRWPCKKTVGVLANFFRAFEVICLVCVSSYLEDLKSCLSGSFCYRYYLLPGGKLIFSVYDFLMKFFCLWFDLWAFYTWLTSILYSDKHWIILPTIILFQGHILENVILCLANFSRPISLQVLRKKMTVTLFETRKVAVSTVIIILLRFLSFNGNKLLLTK